MNLPSGFMLRHQDRRALVLGAIALAAMLVYSRILRPSFEQLSRDTQTLEAQNGLLAREETLLAAAPRLPIAKHEGERILAGEQGRLFIGDSVAATAALASYATGVATAAGVQLSMVEGRPPTSRQGVARLFVDVHGEGNWRQVLAFVRLLESSARLVDVANIRIERGPRGGPLGGDSVALTATIAGYGLGAP